MSDGAAALTMLTVWGLAALSSCERSASVPFDAGRDNIAVQMGSGGSSGAGGASKIGGSGGAAAAAGSSGSGGSSAPDGGGVGMPDAATDDHSDSSVPAGTGGAVGAAGANGMAGAPDPGTGGASAAGTGGTRGTGGAAGTGGATGTGGAARTGGAIGTAGTIGTGGTVATGGRVGTGGAVAAGGTIGTGGVTSTTGTGGGGSAGMGAGATGGHNLVFVTSRTDLLSNLGGASSYDAVCNQLATAAGINGASGNSFVALIADSKSSPLTRLGNARGFVRTDGAPVADDLATVFSQNRLLNPIITNEHGLVQEWSAVLTGLQYDGTTDPTTTCTDYTTAAGPAKFTAGCSNCGPISWVAWESGTCDFFHGSVYCFMKTQSSPLTITPVAGKRIFLTNGAVSVGQSADAACDAAKPAGTGTVSALRSTTTGAASALITLTAKYVRPDGIFVGLGSDLVARKLASGLWQQGNGQYLDARAVWTGSAALTDKGTAASTCSDWTSTTGTMAVTGATSSTDAGFWQNDSSAACASTYTWSYCIER